MFVLQIEFSILGTYIFFPVEIENVSKVMLLLRLGIWYFSFGTH
jgi:hypothetical protein